MTRPSNVIQRYDANIKSDKDEFSDISEQKYYSRSYNRSGAIHKRSFVNPKYNQVEDEQIVYPSTPIEQRQLGKSASHGIGRNYKNAPQLTFNRNEYSNK